jgi:hypothetical protein
VGVFGRREGGGGEAWDAGAAAPGWWWWPACSDCAGSGAAGWSGAVCGEAGRCAGLGSGPELASAGGWSTGSVPQPTCRGAMLRRMEASCLDLSDGGRGLPSSSTTGQDSFPCGEGLQFLIATIPLDFVGLRVGPGRNPCFLLMTTTPAGVVSFLKASLWPRPLPPFLQHRGKPYVQLVGPCGGGAMAPFPRWGRCVSCLWSLRAAVGVGFGSRARRGQQRAQCTPSPGASMAASSSGPVGACCPPADSSSWHMGGGTLLRAAWSHGRSLEALVLVVKRPLCFVSRFFAIVG